MNKPSFSFAETNLMVIYHAGSRLDLIAELSNMLTYVSGDETELHEMTLSTIQKLQIMSDEDFALLDLAPDALKGV